MESWGGGRAGVKTKIELEDGGGGGWAGAIFLFALYPTVCLYPIPHLGA